MPQRTARLIIPVAITFALGLAGVATAAFPTSVNGQITDAVMALDANENAAIDRDEWKKAGEVTFDAVDSDGDGQIGRSEFAFLHGAMFPAIDTDRDGRMTPEEIDAYRRLPWTLGISP